ncbi:MAG: peptidoglycan DD-metalloendopeptidase family protein [Vicingaceae bacterium]
MSAESFKSLILAILMVSVIGLNAQTKEELQQKKKKLLEEIQYTSELLDKTVKSQSTSMDELVKLNKKIEARAEIISTISQEIDLLDNKIEKNKSAISTLESDLKQLKEEYAKMLYYTYKNRSSYNRLMFLFSSKDFNQAYKRLKYLQQYSSYRKRQAELIIQTKTEIDSKIKRLEAIRMEKQVLLNSLDNEKRNLTGEKIQQEGVLTNLQKKEKELKKDLKRKERTAQQLQKAIEEIIREEIRKAREAAAKAGKSSKGFPMTPEAAALSRTFSANKGKLPWPVNQGVITADYGTHPHPVLKQIQVKNNGVDISTNAGAMARAIFEGEVSRVIIIPGEGKSVLVRHGEYLSVYSYMSEVFVNAGDKIKTKQDLGVLVSENNNTKTTMHFELWKGMNTLNPAYWLYVK